MPLERLRILIIGLNYWPEATGVAPYTTEAAEELATRGHEVRVITTYAHYPEWRVQSEHVAWSHTENIRGVEVRRVRHYVPATPTLLSRTISEITFGLRSLKSWGMPDVVVFVSPGLLSSGIGLLRSRLRRQRVGTGLWVQDLYSSGFRETGGRSLVVSRLATRVEASIAGLADSVAAIHEHFRRSLVEKQGLLPDDVHVIRNWTRVPAAHDTDRRAVRSRLGWGQDETVILHSGAMGAKQALENVVEAARLADSRHESVRFVLLGDGSRRRDLEALAEGVRSVQFMGTIAEDDYPQALAAADVLLVNEKPGVTEMSVPSKLTSYFTASKPVLAATVANSATAHEVRTAKAGVIVEPGQPAVLLEAAVGLMRDPALMTEMGANGRKYSQRLLTRGAAIDSLESWASGLAETAGRRSSDRLTT